MISGEPWDAVEDREFWGRVALPGLYVLARLGGAIARRREAERAVDFFTKMAWGVFGAQLAVNVEMNYVANQEKRRRLREREREAED